MHTKLERKYNSEPKQHTQRFLWNKGSQVNQSSQDAQHKEEPKLQHSSHKQNHANLPELLGKTAELKTTFKVTTSSLLI